jgi:integrase
VEVCDRVHDCGVEPLRLAAAGGCSGATAVPGDRAVSEGLVNAGALANYLGLSAVTVLDLFEAGRLTRLQAERPLCAGQVCRLAVRRGWLADNPVAKLEPAEKPRWTATRAAILEGDELARVLAQARTRRPLFEFLAYTGLRIGEALGLTWADIDHDQALVRVHRQLTRGRVHGPLKTEAGRREVVLAPAIAKLLREQWLASSFKAPHHFVFGNTLGRGLDYRDVGEDFRQTLKRAELTVVGERLTLHSFRHGFASLLIAKGLNVVFVSRQLGHANPSITLQVYAHLFERANHANTARAALDASYAAITAADS